MVLEKYVQENYTKLSDKQISEIFNCDVGAVTYARHKNKLYKSPGMIVKNSLQGEELAVVNLHDICAEMTMLIKFCEMTESKALKAIAMRRLKTLSGIPINNEFADQTVGK